MAYNIQSPVFYSYPGNPNGFVAGQASTSNGAPPPSFCFDSLTWDLYACTVSGGASSAVWTLQSSITSNSSAIATLSSAITTLDGEVAANTASITTLNSEAATLNSEVATLNSEVAANTASITTLNSEVAANTASITTLSTEVGTLTTAVASCLTLANFAQSFGSNGYTTLPNGLIIQWGTCPCSNSDGSGSVTLPISFPHGPLRWLASENGAVNWYSNASCTVFGVISCTTTTITIEAVALGSTTGHVGGTVTFEPNSAATASYIVIGH